MFERYTEDARRVIFFARYEASMFSASYIETTHLLLGLLHEGGGLVERFLRPGTSVSDLRKELTAGQPEAAAQVSTSVDLPLSMDSKRVLAYAADESQHLSHRSITIVHLLLGLLRDPTASGFLTTHGVTRDAVVEYAIAALPDEQISRSHGPSNLKTGRRNIPITGGELVVTDAVATGAEPGTIEYSVTVEAFGDKRSWRTTFRVE